MGLQFGAILPDTDFDEKAFERAMRGEARRVADRMERMFDSTVSTWRQKPRFDTVVEVSDDEIAAEVKTHNQIYFYLTVGTSVRYATMSSDWVSKTAPGRLQAGPGRGSRLYVDTRQARRGIDARSFDVQVERLIRSYARQRLEKALERGSRNSGYQT